MRFRCIMRYYHPFPDVIPHTRAGCSRVTHPSATDQTRRSSPFDLNVLCTPPAFILSQDQTLKQIVYHPLKRFDSFELFILAFFTFLELCSLWFWQILYSHLLFCFVLLSSVVQLSSFNRGPFLRALVYYITLFPLCQVLFQNFFKIFLTGVWVISFASLFATALLFYHFPFNLSSTYFKFFSISFTFGYFFKIVLYISPFLCDIYN